MFAKFFKDESGATAIEYTLLAALIGVAIIGSLETLQEAMDSTLKDASDKL
ncbi:MAG: Flp family type IVb pilin [Pseudomonadota bacterium]